MTIAGCSFLNNTAFNAAYGGLGGAISNEDGTMNISSSTLTNNVAADGGGIYNINGHLTVTSTTFSANSAWFGGGLFDNVNTTVTYLAVETYLDSDTITGNRAWYYGSGLGGGIDSLADNVGVKMVSDNVYGNVSDSHSAPDIAGKVDARSSNNLIGVGDAVPDGDRRQ